MLEISMSALTLLLNIIAGLAATSSLVSVEHQHDIHEDLYCLALNSYWEARGEKFDDKLATAQVVMNRVDSEQYPEDVCSVITEGPERESWKTKQLPDLDPEERVYYPVRNKCQFSWYCDGRSDNISNIDGWEDSVIAAYLVYVGFGEDKVNGATHYYAHDKVTPSWAGSMKVTAKLGGHTYLKK